MNQQVQTGVFAKKRNAKKKQVSWLLYIALVFVLPLLSAGVEHYIDHSLQTIQMIGKWFVFWTTGIYLFASGVRQASNPEFTGMSIFRLSSRESYVMMKQLGFANMALGAMGILSVINDQWRVIAAITGGLYFGLGSSLYLFSAPAGKNQLVTQLYYWMVSAGLLAYLVTL